MVDWFTPEIIERVQLNGTTAVQLKNAPIANEVVLVDGTTLNPIDKLINNNTRNRGSGANADLLFSFNNTDIKLIGGIDDVRLYDHGLSPQAIEQTGYDLYSGRYELPLRPSTFRSPVEWPLGTPGPDQ